MPGASSEDHLAWRIFAAHPASVGETYTEHLAAAARLGIGLIAAGLACLLHALVPAAFEDRASRAVARLHRELAERRGEG